MSRRDDGGLSRGHNGENSVMDCDQLVSLEPALADFDGLSVPSGNVALVRLRFGPSLLRVHKTLTVALVLSMAF